MPLPRRLPVLAAFAATAALTLASAGDAMQAPGKCLSRAEAQAVTVAALPDALASARRLCAARLPADAALNTVQPRIASVYQPAADKAWPGASKAFLGIAKIELPPGTDTSFARPLLKTVVTELVAQKLDPGDCPSVNEFYAALEPLPPANVGLLLVALMALDDRNKAQGRTSSGNPFRICNS